MAKLGRPKTSRDVSCVCKNCGLNYAVPEYAPNGRIYCSRACYHEGATGRPKMARRIKRTEKTCPVCKGVFLVGGRRLGELDRGSPRQVCCSRECMAIHKTVAQTARTMTDAEAAWLAGLFDGEGNLCFVKAGRMAFRISIANTNFDLLNRIVSITGTGSIIRRTPKVHNPKHAPSANWQVCGGTALPILRQLLPWLIVKRERVEVVLGLREFTEDLRYVRKGKPDPN